MIFSIRTPLRADRPEAQRRRADPQDAAKAVRANTLNAPALAYKAVVELDTQALALPGGGTLPITAGMAVTAEIHQGTRRVMEYLLSPLQRIGNEAGRER